ncbi:MAG: two-component system, NarL family, sensor histidine kinase LiaS [Chloroflexota bacterium]|nr:two-component system, NarL family, sensor histidine kinase LiaS [Chloroflexota bacterium]
MKKIFKQFRKIQWRLTFTYMIATLLMLFLVELLVLVSNNRDSFSNPYFINITARSLSESSRMLDGALDTPYDPAAISLWIDKNMHFLESNMRQTRPNDPQLPQDQTAPVPQAAPALDLPKLVSKDTQLFSSKPVPFSREKSRLVVASPQGLILGADDETEFPLGEDLLAYLDEDETDVAQQVLNGTATSVVFSNTSTQYASFAFPVMQNGEMKAVVFMRIVAPTLGEEVDAALAGFLPDLPIFLLTSVVVGFIFGSLLASSFTTRIQKLIEYTTRWGKGDFSKIDKVREGDEISELSTALNQMVIQLEELIESKKMLAVLEERNRFARDLHDSVKQEIFSISMNLGAIQALIKTNPEKAGEQLEITAELAKQARNELSALIYTLLPAQLENQDLEIALKEYVNVWENNSGISVVYRTHGRKQDIPQEIEQTIFRITQEALSNIARHSKATATSVTLDYLPEVIRLQISDNGTGFDMDSVKKGLGLRSITERVAENQGKLDVDSGSGGTTITLQFPYHKQDAGGAHAEG